jgi:hypothetical protein
VNSAKVIVNINKEHEAMKFYIEGDKFVLANFTI